MLDDKKQCIACPATTQLEVHHCIYGRANRRLCDEDGLTVYICRKHHWLLHNKGLYRDALRQSAQKYYEKNIGTREQFMQRYGKNFIKENVADE